MTEDPRDSPATDGGPAKPKPPAPPPVLLQVAVAQLATAALLWSGVFVDTSSFPSYMEPLISVIVWVALGALSLYLLMMLIGWDADFGPDYAGGRTARWRAYLPHAIVVGPLPLVIVIAVFPYSLPRLEALLQLWLLVVLFTPQALLVEITLRRPQFPPPEERLAEHLITVGVVLPAVLSLYAVATNYWPPADWIWVAPVAQTLAGPDVSNTLFPHFAAQFTFYLVMGACNLAAWDYMRRFFRQGPGPSPRLGD